MKSSLTSTHPHLVTRWHATRNGKVTADQITAGSHRKIWWRWDCGHEFPLEVYRAVSLKQCVYCSNNRVLPGFNDLATTHPALASYWDEDKNSISVTEVHAGSHKKVHWKCPVGHQWVQRIVEQAGRKHFCSYCAGVKSHKTVQDYPNLAEEWHPTKNGDLTAADVTDGSRRKAWWLCGEGHEWETVVDLRTKRGYGCPYCSGNRVRSGNTDLATVKPELVPQWHPTNNGDLTPQQVSAGSNRKVWWLGECGHEWESTVNNRVNLDSRCPYCTKRKALPGFLLNKYPDVAKQWHPTKNQHVQLVDTSSVVKAWWQCDEGHEWETYVYNRMAGTNCPECSLAQSTSVAEQTLCDYIESLGLEVEQSNRKVLAGKELDIYIPEKQTAIEFNGLYWHTEKHGKHRTYHYDKWLQCKNQGVQLIQIWEDDWNRNPELIKRMLAHKLGVAEERRVFARTTQVVELNFLEAETFLVLMHIQGSAKGSYYLGLRDIEKEELVAVMVLKKEPGTAGRTLNIIRYATSCNVVGGFTKLLKHAEKTYAPDKFITFSDHCVSDGGLYEKNGFVADKELPPDYMYVVKNKRKHKFGYRLKKFRDDPNLLWEEGLTERELAELNNLPRIWDAGKTRWVKMNQK